MPQLALEFSANVIEKNNLSSLLEKCHAILADTLPTNIQHCKSRVIEYHNYYIGDGNKNNAFVHINIHVMPGRTNQILEKISEDIMHILRLHFTQSLQELDLQITLALYELPNIYLKLTK